MRTRNWIFTALMCLMLLCYHSLLRVYYTNQIRDLQGHAKGSSKDGIENSGCNDGFAYVFYATADLYACSTLVNIHRLRTLKSTIPIHVLASEYLSVPFMNALEDANVTVHIEETPQTPALLGSYYEDSLLKMLVFKMHKLDPALERVLILDSDQLILKHFDKLFSQLPGVDIAAPRAYWSPPRNAGTVFSSAFMMINLSDRLWDIVNQTLPSSGGLADGASASAGADMDILNDVFGDTAMILSGEYVTLNSHWETWEVPKWFHPVDAPLINRTVSSRGPEISEARKEPSVEPQADLKVRGDVDHQMPLGGLAVESRPRHPQDSEIFRHLSQLQEYASVVHFTALGKPWTYTEQEVIDERPEAHPLFSKQFGMWRDIAGQVCPETWDVK
ncbi:hypothetical protein VPNG_02191 [Cytospora leucostoma]|uniref:Nucleotide-diphospho-sugar transferase n=1 Tax=Cytospora leucostoma TaxID=1230097 RepID=A0A423XH98_9PEZI|nr:hypothetical protein VPNG_02191 [Cytospora leucostoma]